MISVQEALDNITGSIDLLAAEQVGITDALGRVLAEDISARLTQPPVAVSSMDGYAVRSADTSTKPSLLELIGESAAGSRFDGVVGPGQTARIFTGAPLPQGADAVIMQEDSQTDGSTITFNEVAFPGKFVRPAGLDFEQGQVLLNAGKRLTARDLGLAASMNVPWLMVRRQPRVAYIATGNEIVMPGDTVRQDQIVSSNSIALGAFIKAQGGIPVDLGIALDSVDSLKQRLMAARGADMLVTIGGASVGDYDLVRSVLGDNDLDLTFYKVAMRPGKPLIFGKMGETPVLGLPGNSVSASITSMIFLKPALSVMQGTWQQQTRFETAVLGCDLGENDLRQEYLRASLDVDEAGNLTATPFDKQDSAMMARLAAADCLVMRPPHAPGMKRGERVKIIRFDQSV